MSGSLLSWRAPSDERRRKSSRGKRSEPYVLGAQGEFHRDEFERPENLMVAYQTLKSEGGQAAGMDGVTFKDLSPSEVYSVLRGINQTLHTGNYRPRPHREVKVPKSNGKFRTLNLPTIFDRTVSKALQLAVQPWALERYPDLFQSPWEIFAELEREIRETGWKTFITADITDCFPSMAIEDVLEAHHAFIENPCLLRLVEQVVRGYAGLEKTRGLSQGDPYSPLAAEVTLRHILSETQYGPREDPPSWWRYADNITIVAQDAHQGTQALTRLQTALDYHGLHLRETGRISLNQPQKSAVEILGVSPRWENNRLTWKTSETTWQGIAQRLTECQTHPDPDTHGRNTLEGALTALAPTLMTVDLKGTALKAMKVAQEQGLTPPSLERLTEVIKQAKQNWLDVRSQVLKRNNQSLSPSIGENLFGKIPVRATAHTPATPAWQPSEVTRPN